MSRKESDLIADIKPQPTKERASLGVVELTLDRGVQVKALGQVYGLEHVIQGENFSAHVMLDHYNQRLKVNYHEGENIDGLVDKLYFLAEANHFDKIIVMASKDDWQAFLNHGYVLEAVIKYYLKGKHAYVMSRFRSQERLSSHCLMEEIELIEKLMNETPATNYAKSLSLPEGYSVRLARPEDVPSLLGLYAQIFESYPSPLIHSDYLESIFQKDSLFAVCADADDKVVAAASAELIKPNKAAEITDCATRKEQRGKGLMSAIIHKLEEELRSREFVCAYTMARARSYGMNSAFRKLHYEFMGRLVNNCDIFGAFEDMNIWVKKL